MLVPLYWFLLTYMLENNTYVLTNTLIQLLAYKFKESNKYALTYKFIENNTHVPTTKSIENNTPIQNKNIDINRKFNKYVCRK